MLNIAHAFPIGSYAPGTDYEQVYFNRTGVLGYHSYEADSLYKDALFNNMIFKLPPLRPQSIIDINNPIPEPMKELLVEVRRLYQNGKDKGLIDENETIYAFNEEDISALEDKISKAEKLLEEI